MGDDEFNWRVFLGELTHDPQEKQRLADAMGVSPITLTRWASTGARVRSEQEREKLPRPQVHSLRKLVAALPEYRDVLIPSILQEYQELDEEDFLPRSAQTTSEEAISVPVICYEQVLEATAKLSGELRFMTTSDHILNYSLQQLDAERLGFCVTLLKCVQPQPGFKVRSLQEVLRIGTPPWSMQREERLVFRGAEALAGRAVATQRAYKIGNLGTYVGWLPSPHEDVREVSLAVCPILRTARVAGCLRFASTQADYFTQERMRLLQKYANLALEVFEDVDYYSSEDIELRLMPEERVQMPLLRNFNKRIEDVLAQGQVTRWMQAIQLALHQVESDLIQMVTTKERSG